MSGDAWAGIARRNAYLELRRSGVVKWDAAAQLGGLDRRVVDRYEAWFQAEQRGEQIEARGPGGALVTPAKGSYAIVP